MSKVFMKYKVILILLFNLSLIAQETRVVVEQLKGRINTNDSEFNFVRVNDTLAYFTSITNLENPESSIYFSVKKNSVWSNRKYSKFNLENYKTGEITFTDNKTPVLTMCDGADKCKIVSYKYNFFNSVSSINSQGNKNTQPHFAEHDEQNVLYFVSNRPGGFGGLDIWLSIVDDKGNFGAPINLGPVINTKFDEITPNFDSNSGRMYFASNRENSVGGFDIYFSEGRFNLWNETINFKELNTEKDEMYFNLFNDTIGYLSSNRKGAKFDNEEYCCNDIFKVVFYENQEKLSQNPTICDCMPIKLYFPNNYPSYSDYLENIKITYSDVYRSYFLLKEQYLLKNQQLYGFFEQDLKGNFNKLNEALNTILLRLENGEEIEILVRGHASPLHTPSYNMDLSKRRIKTFKNYIRDYKNGAFKKHINSTSLKIFTSPLGEVNASENISDNPNDLLRSIYSIEAMKERRIEIFEIKSNQKK